MAFDVPLIGKIDWVPQIDLSKIPADEQEGAAYSISILAKLAVYEKQFRAAVLLFDATRNTQNDLVNEVNQGIRDLGSLDRDTDTFRQWLGIAARDGAMSIFHFGCIVAALSAALSACPTLNRAMDHPALRVARNLFKSHFPRYEDIRHVVAHSAEFLSLEQQAAHSATGPIRMAGSGAIVEFLD